jgi:hypothetical protein
VQRLIVSIDDHHQLRFLFHTGSHLLAELLQSSRFLVEKKRSILHHGDIEALPQLLLG